VQNNSVESCAGGFGVSTRIRRVSDGRPLRMKQALLQDFVDISPLCDLIVEGFNGLRIANVAIENDPQLARHLVRTHFFAHRVPGEHQYAHISDLRIISDHVENVGTLYDFIKSAQPEQKGYISSLVEQLLVAVFLLQRDWGIYHNDLHFNNVIVHRVADENGGRSDPLVYKLKDGRHMTIEGHGGYRAVIVDYGRMYQYPEKSTTHLSEILNAGEPLSLQDHQDMAAQTSRKLNFLFFDESVPNCRLSDILGVLYLASQNKCVPDRLQKLFGCVEEFSEKEKKLIAMRNATTKDIKKIEDIKHFTPWLNFAVIALKRITPNVLSLFSQ